MYKSKMASMHFSGDAKEWYKSYKIAKPQPPWPILADEVLSFFANVKGKPIDEFKRIHQIGKVEDYIKSFLRAQSRLYCKTQIDHEEFYVGCFMSGLKEEIRNTIDLFNPATLKEAFDYAKKIEITLDGAAKKNSNSSRYQLNSTTRLIKSSEVSGKRWNEVG